MSSFWESICLKFSSLETQSHRQPLHKRSTKRRKGAKCGEGIRVETWKMAFNMRSISVMSTSAARCPKNLTSMLKPMSCTTPANVSTNVGIKSSTFAVHGTIDPSDVFRIRFLPCYAQRGSQRSVQSAASFADNACQMLTAK